MSFLFGFLLGGWVGLMIMKFSCAKCKEDLSGCNQDCNQGRNCNCGGK